MDRLTECGGVHFDEAHELAKEFQTTLYLALDQRRLAVGGGRSGKAVQSVPLTDFTVLLSTTDEYGLPRINATPFTQAQRRKLAPSVRPAGPASAVAPSVPAVVPPNIIPQIKPGVPGGTAGVTGSWFML